MSKQEVGNTPPYDESVLSAIHLVPPQVLEFYRQFGYIKNPYSETMYQMLAPDETDDFVHFLVDHNNAPIIIHEKDRTLVIVSPLSFDNKIWVGEKIIGDRSVFVCILDGWPPLECATVYMTLEEGEKLEKKINERIRFNAFK